jgi:hypothetical protein
MFMSSESSRLLLPTGITLSRSEGSPIPTHCSIGFSGEERRSGTLQGDHKDAPMLRSGLLGSSIVGDGLSSPWGGVVALYKRRMLTTKKTCTQQINCCAKKYDAK